MNLDEARIKNEIGIVEKHAKNADAFGAIFLDTGKGNGKIAGLLLYDLKNPNFEKYFGANSSFLVDYTKFSI